ncbi:hypothetical protein ACQHIV_24470 [Kribbella sp. GL6]|uniref:hypothetical protein n=1 Tax=Kribbella sp. GL6 TaxID=3419765 RepID=UPI003D0381B7
MISILLAVYALFVLGLSALAGCVAIFMRDAGQRESAYRVLKLVLGTGTGAGGVVAIAIELYRADLWG